MTLLTLTLCLLMGEWWCLVCFVILFDGDIRKDHETKETLGLLCKRIVEPGH